MIHLQALNACQAVKGEGNLPQTSVSNLMKVGVCNPRMTHNSLVFAHCPFNFGRFVRFAPVPVTLIVCSSRKGRFSHKEGEYVDIFLEAGENLFQLFYHSSPSFSLAGTSITLGLSMILAVLMIRQVKTKL